MLVITNRDKIYLTFIYFCFSQTYSLIVLCSFDNQSKFVNCMNYGNYFIPSKYQSKKISLEGCMITTSNLVLDFFLMSKLFNEIV